MTPYRQAIESILSSPVKVVTVDSEKEFIHLDQHKGTWRLTITKSLVQKENK